jgi:hypothetical protein
MDIVIGNSVYHQCYDNKYIKDGKPHFDLLHPDKLAPVPMYKYEKGKMELYMVPCEITLQQIAPNAEEEYSRIKKTDLDTWHYLKEKYKEWVQESAKRQLEHSTRANTIKPDHTKHKRLMVPFMERFN